MRKTRTKGGDQHAISCRIDNNTWEWLNGEQNKNRLINDALEFVKRTRDAPHGTCTNLQGIMYKKMTKDLWE